MHFSYVKKHELKHIAEIWFKTFNYNFYSIVGKKEILRYLHMVYLYNKKFLFKIKNNNEIKGFVIFGDDTYLNQLYFKNSYVRIMNCIIKNLFFFRIFRIYYIVKILFYFFNNKNFNYFSKNSLDLIVICVEKKRGLGTSLLKHSLNEIFKKTSIEKIFVKTAYPSKKTYNFYKKNGFKFYKKTFFSKWQILYYVK